LVKASAIKLIRQLVAADVVLIRLLGKVIIATTGKMAARALRPSVPWSGIKLNY